MNSHCKEEMTSSDRENKDKDDADRVTFVGLDISKATLDIHTSGTHRQEDNTPKGHKAFIRHLRSLAHPRVICEASGGYEAATVAVLHAAGIEVCVVHAARARDFASSNGWLAKNDRIDARSLAAFGEKIRPRLEAPPCPARVRLREMIDYRRITRDQISESNNRLELASGYLKEALAVRITVLKVDLKKVEKDIAAHIAADPDLAAKAERMTQLKGAGPVLAATLLAHLPELGTIDDKKIAALAGVAPHPKDSGKSKPPRRVAGGRGQVRTVLYMASISAARSNPILKAFYQRLRHEKGKPHKVAIVAVMRKMLTVLNRLLTDPKFSVA